MLRPSVMLILFAAALPAQEKKAEFKLTEAEQAVLDATNAERKAKKLPELKADPKLTEAARSHAANMAKQDKLDHDLDGKGVADRVKDAGYEYRGAGENIAWNKKDAKEAVESWMQSQGHRENILNDQYTEIGVAMAKNAKGERYWCQVFAVPTK
jgi:uncharacterized protein YkwD